MPVMRICVIPDSATTTMNELTFNELALMDLDTIEDGTIVFAVNQLLDTVPARYFGNKKKISKKPPWRFFAMECGVWSYENTENVQKRAAIQKKEKPKICQPNKSKYRLRRYYEC